MKYDPAMIKDFLEQLAWALRTDHFEFTNGPGVINPELAEMGMIGIKRERLGFCRCSC